LLKTNQYIMKQIIILLLFIPIIGIAQIPNPDFELWETQTKQIPNEWKTYGKTSKVKGYRSENAIKIERDNSKPNEPGAFVYGNPENNFSGGIACKSRPDSVVVFLKKNYVVGDTAWFIVMLKRNGSMISETNFKLFDSDTSQFIRHSFYITYTDTGRADSLIIGVTSTNPEDNFLGSFVIVDSLHFIGDNNIMIPNSNFESWTTLTIENPKNWNVMGGSYFNGNYLPSVSKTSEKLNGNYAVKIQNTPLGNEFTQGFIMSGQQGNDGPLPGFAVQGRDTVVYVSYKAFPKNGDKASIGIFMFKNGQMVGSGLMTQSYTINHYSQTAIPINYFNNFEGIPDSASIYCAAFEPGDNANGASIIYVDGFSFNKPTSGLNTQAKLKKILSVFPNPASSIITIEYLNTKNNPIEFKLFNHQGQLIINEKTTTSYDGINKYRIDVEGLNNGIYTLKIISNDYFSSEKITIQ
jgi:hypothetical protein